MGPPASPRLLLFLLACLARIAAAPPSQGSSLSPRSCKENQFYDATAQKCCYQCQPGSIPKTKCPTDPNRECRKPCPLDQYLNQKLSTPRCEACVSCPPERDLVEKAPCTNVSDRVCVCRPGMRCESESPNACSLCVPLTTSEPGFGVRTAGGSEGAAGCEGCLLGIFSGRKSSPEALSSPADPAAQLSVTMRSATASSVPGMAPGSTLGTTTRGRLDEFSTSHFADILPVEKPSKKDGHSDFTLVGASVVCFLVLFAALLILWQRKTCKKWIVPQQINLSDQAKCCAKRIRSLNLEEEGEGGAATHLASLAESPGDESSLLEADAAPGPDPEGAELGQAGSGALLDPPLLSHTSNCIEKIYIMRADTVIVGSVSEVPAGKICSAREEEGSSGAQEEGGPVAHYPEQETEFYPASSVTTPVEEEWEFQPSSEKALVI